MINNTFPKDLSKKIYNEFVDDYEGFIRNTNDKIYEYKKVIYEFVKQNFDDYDFERFIFKNYSQQNILDGYLPPHKNINEFIEYNKNVINKLENKEVYFLMQLIDRINYKSICNMDKEHMTSFRTSGFYWDKDGKLVIFNER